MLRKIIVLIPLLCLVSILALSNVAKTPSTPAKHISKEAGYSIQFPADWEIAKGMMGTDVVAMAPVSDPEDLFRENINVIYADFDYPITSEEYYDYNLKSLNQLLNDFDLEKNEDVTINGVKAKKIIFTHNMGLVNAKVMQLLILVGNRAYVVTFTADPLDFDKYFPIFDDVGKSFSLDAQHA